MDNRARWKSKFVYNNPGFIFPPPELSKNLTICFFASVFLLPFSGVTVNPGAEPESQWYVTIEPRGWPKKASYLRVEVKEAYLDCHPTIFQCLVTMAIASPPLWIWNISFGREGSHKFFSSRCTFLLLICPFSFYHITLQNCGSFLNDIK